MSRLSLALLLTACATAGRPDRSSQPDASATPQADARVATVDASAGDIDGGRSSADAGVVDASVVADGGVADSHIVADATAATSADATPSSTADAAPTNACGVCDRDWVCNGFEDHWSSDSEGRCVDDANGTALECSGQLDGSDVRNVGTWLEETWGLQLNFDSLGGGTVEIDCYAP